MICEHSEDDVGRVVRKENIEEQEWQWYSFLFQVIYHSSLHPSLHPFMCKKTISTLLQLGTAYSPHK
jgi:hypothetical protein